MNFQTVPIHSDAGNLNSTIFQGYDPNMCPIIGEIQMYELANASNSVNATFTQYTNDLYKLFQSKGFQLPPQNDMVLEDYKAIIEEVQTNKLELRYIPEGQVFSQGELDQLTKFMQDYNYQFLQGNDTVTQLSTNDFFNYLIFNLEERARQLLNDPKSSEWAKKFKTQKYTYLGLTEQALISLLKGILVSAVDSTYLPQATSSLIFEFY